MLLSLLGSAITLLPRVLAMILEELRVDCAAENRCEIAMCVVSPFGVKTGRAFLLQCTIFGLPSPGERSVEVLPEIFGSCRQRNRRFLGKERTVIS